MFWIALLAVALALGAAIATILLRSYVAAVAAVSVVGLAMSVLFVVLRAPDVALAEAAVGAGLTGVLFALALRRMGLGRSDGGE